MLELTEKSLVTGKCVECQRCYACESMLGIDPALLIDTALGNHIARWSGQARVVRPGHGRQILSLPLRNRKTV
jgi:hypothetical protein